MYAFSRIEHEYEMMNEMIESEMHKVKETTLEKLSSYFAHSPVSIKSLSLTIAYGYWESNEHAEIVAEQLGLGKLEFLALSEDFDGFKEEYLATHEEAQNF
jgi:aromatic ring-opening dioxygenase catalytic subunit (LigB family)